MLKNNSPVIPPSPTYNIDSEKLNDTGVSIPLDTDDVDESCVFEDNPGIDDSNSRKDDTSNTKATSNPLSSDKTKKHLPALKEKPSKDSSSRNQTNQSRNQPPNYRNNS